MPIKMIFPHPLDDLHIEVDEVQILGSLSNGRIVILARTVDENVLTKDCATYGDYEITIKKKGL